MPSYVSIVVKYKNEGVLVLTWIKDVWIFKNKKAVHLFTHNSTNFLYQTNQRTLILPDGKLFSVSYEDYM